MASNEASEIALAISPDTVPAQTSTSRNTTRDKQHRALLGTDVGLAAYSTARTLHKFGRHIQTIAGAFDPTLDVGDADNVSDYSVSESEREADDDERSDDNSIRSQHSDDEDVPHEEAKNVQSSNSKQHDTSQQMEKVFAAELPKTLPPTRSAKVDELPGAWSKNPETYVAPAGTPLGTPVKSTAVDSAPFTSAKSISPTVQAKMSAVLPTIAPQSTDLPQARSEISKPVQPATLIDKPVVDSPTELAKDKLAMEKPIAEKLVVEQPVDHIQYEIVKVRKKDGTIGRVRRPIRPAAEITTATQNKTVVPLAAPTSETAPESLKDDATGLNAGSTPYIQKEAPKFAEASPESKSTYNVVETEKQDERSPPPSKLPQTKAEILHRRTSRVTQIIIWSIMIASPLVFLVLGILTACATGKPKDSALGQGITRANKIAVSIWPIAFAATAAQALRMYASWKVESGLKLMILEQLINSHSVASAIKQPFLLQRIDFTSVALLCLWGLSPIAGQAFVRMSYVGNSGAVNNVPLHYLNNTATDIGIFNDGVSSISEFVQTINALFGSLILSRNVDQQAAMDPWGNLKIPAMESLTTMKDGWFTVPAAPSYSSLLGIPISGLAEDGSNTSFSIQTMYYAFECPTLIKSTLDAINETVTAANPNIQLSGTLTLYMTLLPPTNETATRVLYASQIQGESAENDFDYTTCTIGQTFAESHVLCAGKQCRVDKMRPSTPHDFPPGTGWANMIMQFAIAGASDHPSFYSPLQYFLNNTATAGILDSDTPDISSVPTKDFNARLSILLNTYWLAGIAPYTFTGALVARIGDPALVLTTAVATSTAQVYHTSWGWLGLLLATGLLLLVGGVASAYCDSRTVGPDIFGFASSLAHRNKYIRAPTGTGDSTIGGPERARKLADVVVMLQDVKPEHPVGRIALGTVENGGAKLRLGRRYK